MSVVLSFPAYSPRRDTANLLPSSRIAFLQAVREQVAIIQRSPGFIHARRMQRFLEFVVQETLEGRSGQLCEYAIAVSVFDRAESFQPGLDPIVRNDARRLRQKLADYYHSAVCGKLDRMVIQIPKGTYVPTFLPVGASETTAAARFRLTVSLMGIEDDRELWKTEREICSDELTMGVLIKLPGRSAR